MCVRERERERERERIEMYTLTWAVIHSAHLYPILAAQCSPLSHYIADTIWHHRNYLNSFLAVSGKALGSVVHDAEEIVGYGVDPVIVRPFFSGELPKVVVRAVSDVLSDNSDVGVAIPTRVFMPETEGMTNLVHGMTFREAVNVNRDFLRPSDSPNIRRTPTA